MHAPAILKYALPLGLFMAGCIHNPQEDLSPLAQYQTTQNYGALIRAVEAKQVGPEGDVHNYIAVHVGPEGIKTEVVRLMGTEWKRALVQ